MTTTPESSAERDPDLERELEGALALVSLWHDEKPSRRRALRREEVRGLRVLGPVQIRLRTLLEEREYDLQPGPPPDGPAPVEAAPKDPWGAELEALDLDAMVEDATEERTRWTEMGSVVRPCETCEGSGQRPCERCDGQGLDGVSTCAECAGEGKRDCRDCRGGARREVRVRVRRRFRFAEATRVHEDPDSEVGPHVLLHLVDHPTKGEVFDEQDAPRIQRYAGKGSGGGYRTAASPLAATVETLLAAPAAERDERIVHQWLTVKRIPVYALDLSRRRTAYVYGDPPEVSPPGLLRPAWLVVVPLLVAMVLLAAVALTFFWLVANAEMSGL